MPVEQISSTGPVDDLAQDALGSTRLLTDSRGTVVGTTSYSPYGQVTAQSGTVTTPFGFAGQYTDSQTGLVSMRARWYDPGTGQFLSQDLLWPLTTNPYAYVADNPLNAVDPLGMCGPQCSIQAFGIMHFGSPLPCPAASFTETEMGMMATGIQGLFLVVPGIDLLDGMTIEARLAWYAEQAAAQADEQGLTPNQAEAVEDYPGMYKMFRGYNIDQIMKDMVQNDALLKDQGLQITPPGNAGPDFSTKTGTWYDLTTPGQWQAHVTRYSGTYGIGTRIPYP